MAYSKQTWVNRSTSATTPLSASRLNHIEDGIEAAAADADSALSASYTDEQVRDVIGATLVAGSNVTVTVNDGADTITIASTGGGGGGGGSTFAVLDGTSGNVSTSVGTSWVAVNSSTWDVSIAAAAGDVIEAGFSGRIIAAAADNLHVDMFTVISSTMTNSWATNAALSNSAAGMLFVPTSGNGITATRRRACASGDLSGGSITFRLAWRNNGTTASPTACASTGSGVMHIWVANHGQ